MKKLRMRMFMLLSLIAATPVHAEISVLDDRGERIVFSATPQRVISLLPSLTESVCAIGACDRLVGTDRFSNSPFSVLKLPKLGGLDDAQVERIVALKPDAVLIAPSARVIDRLESLGLKVIVVDSNSHADVQRSLLMLGRLLDRTDAAALLWSRIQTEIADAAQQVPHHMRGATIYYEIDSTPYAAGASSFIGETFAQLGLRSAIPATLGPFPRLNPEFVLRLQPDIVMSARRELDEMPQRPGWSAMRALKAHRSCGFDKADAELLIRPGPRMGEAANVLVNCLISIDKHMP